jgi:hypothetical protein
METKYQVLIVLGWNQNSFALANHPLTKDEAYEQVHKLSQAEGVSVEIVVGDNGTEYVGIPPGRMKDIWFVAQAIPEKEKAQVLSIVKKT